MRAIDRYFTAVVQFRERFSVTNYITSGAPSRTDELASIRWCNSEREIRNAFIEDGIVVFVTRYHKAFHVSNNIKVIQRYLPQEVSELFV
jgi:hypothetical protein